MPVVEMFEVADSQWEGFTLSQVAEIHYSPLSVQTRKRQ